MPGVPAGAELGGTHFEDLLLQLAKEHRRVVRQAEQAVLRAAGDALDGGARSPTSQMRAEPPSAREPRPPERADEPPAPGIASEGSPPAPAEAFLRSSARAATGASSISNGRGHQGVMHVKRMLKRYSFAIEKDDELPPGDDAERTRPGALRRASTMVNDAVKRKLAEFNPSATQVFAEDDADERSSGWLRRLVRSPSFELVMAVLIFVNTLVLAIEAQYDGILSGYDNQLAQDAQPANLWPGARASFEVFEWFFGILFTLEFIAKLVAVRVEYFFDPWNGLDFVIVAFWLLERVFKEFLPLDPKLVRMARLARLLRFLRVVKTIQAFDSLYLMMSSIKSSISALAWSSVVLLLLEMMLALFLNVMLEDFWTDPDKPEEDRQKIYDYYGTFTRALQTMVEMLLGNWYTITRLLTSSVSEWYVLFGVSHQLIVGFAVIEVITGVFLHQTFKVANMDDGILLNETKREIKDQSEKMLRFFQHADLDGNGELDKAEFKQVLERDKVQEWMNAMGLDVHQVERVFTLFDVDRSGTISPEELVAGTLQLKGQAKAMELALVRAQVDDIHRLLLKRARSPRIEGRGSVEPELGAEPHPGHERDSDEEHSLDTEVVGDESSRLPGQVV